MKLKRTKWTQTAEQISSDRLRIVIEKDGSIHSVMYKPEMHCYAETESDGKYLDATDAALDDELIVFDVMHAKDDSLVMCNGLGESIRQQMALEALHKFVFEPLANTEIDAYGFVV